MALKGSLEDYMLYICCILRQQCIVVNVKLVVNVS